MKDVLIGDDTITIRHSIPVPQGLPQGGCLPPSQTAGPNYLLCKGSTSPLLSNLVLDELDRELERRGPPLPALRR